MLDRLDATRDSRLVHRASVRCRRCRGRGARFVAIDLPRPSTSLQQHLHHLRTYRHSALACVAGTHLDGAVMIDDTRTIATVFRLLKDEGLYVGASSALNVVAASDVARKLGPGHTIVTMVCDSANRYATRLFSKTWLESKGLYTSVPDDCKHLVSLP